MRLGIVVSVLWTIFVTFIYIDEILITRLLLRRTIHFISTLVGLTTQREPGKRTKRPKRMEKISLTNGYLQSPFSVSQVIFN